MQHLLWMILWDESPSSLVEGIQAKALGCLGSLTETSKIITTRRQFGMSIAVTQSVQL